MYSVIENHKDFLLINKYPGVSFHKAGKEQGLVEVIRTQTGIKELHTVHRLDRITSGLMLFAKCTGPARELSNQFRNRRIDKYYLAVSDRRPKKKQGLIKGDMVKARRGAWKLARTCVNPAVTQFFSDSLGGGLRLFILKPHTGKTHQIRVAMKSLGSPVLGDPLYHKKEGRDREPDRGYLHCYAMRFKLWGVLYEFIYKPDAGKYFLSEEFNHVLKMYEKPWMLKWPSI